MDIPPEERALLDYLYRFRAGPGDLSPLTLGLHWAVIRGVDEGHTGEIARLFERDWAQFRLAALSLHQKGLIGLREKTATADIWLTDGGRAAQSPPPAPAESAVIGAPRASTWERIVAAGAAVVILGLVVYLAVRNEPIADPNIVVLIRIVVSLAMSVLAATVPGFLHVGWAWRGVTIRAGGAIAVFVLTFLGSPKVIPQAPPSPPSLRIGEPTILANRTIATGQNVALWVDHALEGSTFSWSAANHGRLDHADRAAVRYTAERPGEETLELVVTPPRGKPVHLRLDFRVVAALEAVKPGPVKEDEIGLAAGHRDQVVFRGSVNNTLAIPVRVRAITVSLDRFHVDETPHLAFEMFPFLECLVIRPVDRGWGPPPVGKLTVFDAQRPDPADFTTYLPADDLRKIFDLGKESLTLAGAEWGRFQFLRIGPGGLPFASVGDMASTADAAGRGPRGFVGGRREVLAVSRAVTRLELVHKGTAPGVGGAVMGQFGTAAGPTRCPYRTRHFQPVPVSRPARHLADLLSVPVGGGIQDRLLISTGDIEPVSLATTVMHSASFYGAYVSLGDGTPGQLSLPVLNDIAARQSFEVELTLFTAKAASFSGAVGVEYQVGDGPILRHEVGRLTGTTSFLREDATDWTLTEQFLKEARDFDPGLLKTAIAFLADAKDRKPPVGKTVAEREQFARKCRDAVLVVAASAPLQTKQEVVGQFLKRPLRAEDLAALMPVVCTYVPEAALEKAIAALDEQPSLLGCCACFPETAKLLSRYRPQIERAVRAGKFDWPPQTKVALGILAALPEETWRPTPERPWTEEWAVAAWAVHLTPGTWLENLVRSRLRTQDAGRGPTTEMVEALAATKNERLWDEVADLAQKTEGSALDFDLLLASLRYLSEFRVRPGIKPLLRRLEQYPYDGRIRELSTRMLGAGR